MVRTQRLLILVAITLLCALPAVAEVYTVTLTNGASFETRYRPVSDQDGGRVALLTDQGNWISLPREIVTDVSSSTEERGFGRVIDSNTIDLGFLRNPQQEEGEAQAPDSATQLLRYLEARDQQAPYSVQQFVEPEQAGGIPVDFTRTTTPPIGGFFGSRPRPGG